MATIDTAIGARLAGYAGLIALVGTRIYLPPVPQNATYPLVTFQEIDSFEDLTMGNSSGLPRTRFQFDCWADTAASARAVGAQVFATFHNYAGTSDTIVIKNSLYDGGQPMEYIESEGVHRYMLEFLIQYVRV